MEQSQYDYAHRCIVQTVADLDEFKALADRFAEALAELTHKKVRELFNFGLTEDLSASDLIAEKYRGIRPAPGYPACPRHEEKLKI